MLKTTPWKYWKRFINSITNPIMHRNNRYFKNPYPDYENQKVEIPTDEIKNRIVEISNKILSNMQPTLENCDGGLYLGAGGIAYAMFYLSKSPFFNVKEKQAFMEHSLEYIKPALEYAKTRDNVKSEASSFLLGNAGVYALATVLFNETGDNDKSEFYRTKFTSSIANCSILNFLSCGSDELFVGRAGYICGALWMNKELKKDVLPSSDLIKLAETTIMSGDQYSKKHSLSFPLMYSYYNTEYLGAAHGVCSILQMLMSIPDFLQSHPLEASLVKRSVDKLLQMQTNTGNFPCSLDEEMHPSSQELVHWCHGAPGVIYTLAKAYLLWKDQKYLDGCLKCGDLVWEKGLLRKGPGICHGVAGNGYVFLLLNRLTNDPKHLYRALQFYKFLSNEQFLKEARTPDSPYSLYEGLAGTACFLADLANPNDASFPFQDVF